MKRSWIFINNTFEINTRGSQTRALRLFRDFDSKLRATAANDPDIALILSDFSPIFLAYEALHAQRDYLNGTYKGQTLNFEKELSKLPDLLRIWEGQVHFYYPQDSPDEVMIFPRRRTPFLQGSYDDRISAVHSLILSLGDYANLLPLQSKVQTYYNTLTAARDMQQQKEGLADQISSLLEDQRIITAQEMYGGFGRLIFKFRASPDKIIDYIDLELLRSDRSSNDTAIIKGKVTTQTGVEIVGARVSLPQLGYEVDTDSLGNYELEIEAGTWRIEVSAAGYATHIHPDVVFGANATVTLDFQLAI